MLKSFSGKELSSFLVALFLFPHTFSVDMFFSSVFLFFRCVCAFISVVKCFVAPCSALGAFILVYTGHKQAPNSLLVVHIKSVFFSHSPFSLEVCSFSTAMFVGLASFLIKHTLAVANDCDEDNYGILLRT